MAQEITNKKLLEEINELKSELYFLKKSIKSNESKKLMSLSAPALKKDWENEYDERWDTY